MNKIKKIRENSGLSQSDFARRHLIPLRTLQQWEQGRRVPPDYVIKNIEEKEKALMIVRDYVLPPKDKFKVCISKPFKNCEKIYPIQQERIFEIIKQIKNDSNVLRAIVFGSSVTNACHIESDIDIYFQLVKNKKVKLRNVDYKIDTWSNFSVDKNLYSKIHETGVVVYG